MFSVYLRIFKLNNFAFIFVISDLMHDEIIKYGILAEICVMPCNDLVRDEIISCYFYLLIACGILAEMCLMP